jgi:hypothetical protein
MEDDMLIENLTVKEWIQLVMAVERELGYHEDNAARYAMSGGDYPDQVSLDSLRSLHKKITN